MTRFITAYTPGYEDLATDLVRSGEAYGIVVEATEYPDRGSWEKNCAFKAEHIEAALIGATEPIVWVDADAFFVRKPEGLDDLRCDLAVNIARRKDTGQPELRSGTMYWEPTDLSRQLAGLWVAECAKWPNEWDQRVLHRLVLTWPGSLRNLDGKYTAIRARDGSYRDDAVILHTQASRDVRAGIRER